MRCLARVFCWDGPAMQGRHFTEEADFIGKRPRIMPVVCKGMGDAAHACGWVASRLPVA